MTFPRGGFLVQTLLLAEVTILSLWSCKPAVPPPQKSEAPSVGANHPLSPPNPVTDLVAELTGQIARQGGGSADLYLQRGVLLLQLNRLDSALADFNAALRINSKLAPAYYYRGRVRKLRRESDSAFADFQQAVDCDPNYAPGYCGRGAEFLARGDTNRALEDYNRAIALEPDNPLAFNLRAVLFHKAKNYRASIADFTRCLELEPKSSPHYMSRGWEYLCLKDTARALEDFRAARDLGHPDAQPWLDMLLGTAQGHRKKGKSK